jgi:AraC-like DNA-binding protein
MAHIAKEDLAVYAADPDAVDAAGRAATEREIAACAECRTSFEFMAVADDDLPDPDVWEPLTGTASLDSLWAHGARIAAEDEEAAAMLQPLLGAPVWVAWRSFRPKRYRTGGVVRKLIAHAPTLHEREPLAALTFADAAITIAEALAAVQACYRKKTAVRVSEFASFLGVTPEYLSGMVRQLTGQTPRDFLRAKQLRYAEQLLQVTPLPVDEIALRSGFGTSATFYRCFHAKHATTPGAFREVKK